jgi:putative flippase GtrA
VLLARFLRFTLVGSVATAIQYAVLVLLVHGTKADPIWASAAGFVVSAFANYFINYRYTFCSRQRHAAALTKFSVLASIGLFLNAAIMSGLIHSGLHYFPAQIVATVVVLLWNFSGNSAWTFRTRVGRE